MSDQGPFERTLREAKALSRRLAAAERRFRKRRNRRNGQTMASRTEANGQLGMFRGDENGAAPGLVSG